MRLLCCVLLTSLLQLSYSASLIRNKRWNMNSPDYVMAPGSGPLSLDDPRRQRMTETFSDSSQGLTVVKDPTEGIKACFITDLDPEFALSTLDKLEIADAQEPLIINNPMKYKDFQSKAGPMITKLCSRLHIFWMNEPGPLPLQPLGGSQNVKAPPALIRTPPPLVKAPPSLVKSPPGWVKSPSSGIRTPPPVHLANHNQIDTVLAPGDLPPPALKTPPPLPHVMKTPPPLHKDIRAPPSL